MAANRKAYSGVFGMVTSVVILDDQIWLDPRRRRWGWQVARSVQDEEAEQRLF
jgi:hypothetical protein